MPTSLLEDIVFIVFFFSLYIVLNTSVPYIYNFLCIDMNDHLLIIVFWLVIFLVMAFLLKYLQRQRYEDELEDLDDIFGDGFDSII